jgi:hypothetical protein
LKRLRRLHVDDGLDLLRIAIDSSLRDEVAQQMACRYSKGTLLRVELDQGLSLSMCSPSRAPRRNQGRRL